MRKKTQYIVVNEIYKTIYCGYPQKRAWNVFETESLRFLFKFQINSLFISINHDHIFWNIQVMIKNRIDISTYQDNDNINPIKIQHVWDNRFKFYD